MNDSTKFTVKKKALLIVDVQNDFCPGGALAVPNGDKVVAPLNELIRHAQRNGWLIIASRDWHPEKTAHFEKWPIHCVQGTKGAKFHPLLNIGCCVTVVSKGVNPGENAYSAFNGRFANGLALDEFLKTNGVEIIYVGGLATDYCVKATAIDAAKLGYETYFLLDASRAVNLNPGDEKNARQEMIAAGVTFSTTTSAAWNEEIK